MMTGIIRVPDMGISPAFTAYFRVTAGTAITAITASAIGGMTHTEIADTPITGTVTGLAIVIISATGMDIALDIGMATGMAGVMTGTAIETGITVTGIITGIMLTESGMTAMAAGTEMDSLGMVQIMIV